MFSKPWMTSTLAAEYVLDGSRMRVSNQFEVEQVVIAENFKCFVLAYKSPIFSSDIIKKIGMFGETKSSQDLIFHSQPITDVEPELASFL